MPDIGTADVKPSDFTSLQCQYLAYSPCCLYRCECRYSNMHNYIACSCDGWRGMSYNELHMQVPEAVFAVRLSRGLACTALHKQTASADNKSTMSQ